jgi:hypothetical protein
MKSAIMQPYFLPYIGYFQLINAVDTFIFYDDVNFINRSWINRNSFLINGQKQLITLPCKGASQNKLINEIDLKRDGKEFSKFLKTVEMSYRKAPFFKDVFPILTSIFEFKNDNLARFTANSVIEIAKYLGQKSTFKFSSENYGFTRGMDKADRLIEITKLEDSDQYINPIGGLELYSKEYFLQRNIKLKFLESKETSYNQFDKEFIPWLSILDVLMFNSISETNELLKKYTLK